MSLFTGEHSCGRPALAKNGTRNSLRSPRFSRHSRPALLQISRDGKHDYVISISSILTSTEFNTPGTTGLHSMPLEKSKMRCHDALLFTLFGGRKAVRVPEVKTWRTTSPPGLGLSSCSCSCSYAHCSRRFALDRPLLAMDRSFWDSHGQQLIVWV